MSKPDTDKADAYQIITDRIIALLEKGVVPWRQPWKTRGEAGLPKNLSSGRAYRGCNVFLLGCQGYTSPWWVTYNQAKERGGNVRKGERATPVVFWRIYERKTGERKADGSPVVDKIPVLRYYNVFNVEQCDGIDAPALEAITGETWNPIESAERIVSNMPKRPEIKRGGDRAAYSPSMDRVAMPDREAFQDPSDYYGTLFHELAHSTGHESRLNRRGVSGEEGDWGKFGTQSYAKEELVAEMTAAFLCGFAGIVDSTLDSSASYLDNWLRVLKSDRKLVVHAAASAQKAADFILDRKSEAEE